MQALSLILVVGFVLLASLAIGLAILASPVFAAIGFLIAFGAFLSWRGSRRAETGRGAQRSRVPTTEEAAADTVEDSGSAIAGDRPRA